MGPLGRCLDECEVNFKSLTLEKKTKNINRNVDNGRFSWGRKKKKLCVIYRSAKQKFFPGFKKLIHLFQESPMSPSVLAMSNRRHEGKLHCSWIWTNLGLFWSRKTKSGASKIETNIRSLPRPCYFSKWGSDWNSTKQFPWSFHIYSCFPYGPKMEQTCDNVAKIEAGPLITLRKECCLFLVY